MKPPCKLVHRNERGVVIIWSAFFMLMMLGFVALGIDVAKLMATRTELQNAADAAALAGASALDRTTGQLMPDTAVARAQYTSSGNKAFVDAPVSVTLLAADVQVDAAERTVRVTVRRNASTDGSMITHVAQVLGITRVDVNATATAKAEKSCQVCEKITPMGALPPQGEPEFVASCAREYTLVQGQGGGATGNWQSLSLPECQEGPCAGMPATGANTFRCLVEHGYGCCIDVDQIVQTEPGQMNGPLRQGLQALYDQCPFNVNECYRDHSERHGGAECPRVVFVPVIESLGAGRTDVRVIGIAAFFLKERPVGGPAQPVLAEFVREIVPGTGGNCNSTVFTIRLIQ